MWFETYRVGNRLMVLAGIAGRDGDGHVVDGVAEQTRVILAGVERLLAEQGAGRSAVARNRVFLTDVSNWLIVRRELETFFGTPSPPCTAVAGIVLVEPAMLVEIECEAFLPPRAADEPQ